MVFWVSGVFCFCFVLDLGFRISLFSLDDFYEMIKLTHLKNLLLFCGSWNSQVLIWCFEIIDRFLTFVSVVCDFDFVKFRPFCVRLDSLEGSHFYVNLNVIFCWLRVLLICSWYSNSWCKIGCRGRRCWWYLSRSRWRLADFRK